MYQAIYKCRLCGEIFINKGTIIKGEEDDDFDDNKDTFVIDAIWDVICEVDEYDSCCDYTLINPHHCRDESVGVADFQGFKKVGD